MHQFLLFILLFDLLFCREYRPQDGSFNNLEDPQMGAINTPYKREMPAHYQNNDGKTPIDTLPSPRNISEILFSTTHQYNSHSLNDLHTYWGMFMNLDVGAVALSDTLLRMPVPRCDPWFDPGCFGNQTLQFQRVEIANGTGTPSVPLLPINKLTSWLDLSAVYPSCAETPDQSNTIRTFQDGKIVLDDYYVPAYHWLGPWRRAALAEINNVPGYAALHELFVRNHNRLCDSYKIQHPNWDDETLYQEARRWNIATFQKISLRDYLPPLLGAYLPPYKGD